MPLSGTGSTLGPQIAALCNPADVVSPAIWTSICSALTSFFVSGTVVLPGPMVAAGAAVTGLGSVTCPSGVGSLLASAVPATDPAGQAKWQAIGLALESWYQTGHVNPALFVATPTGGPVTGTGLYVPTGAPLLAAAATVPTDAVGTALWGSIATAIAAHFSSNILVPATGFTSPNGGGPLTGVGTIT